MEKNISPTCLVRPFFVYFQTSFFKEATNEPDTRTLTTMFT